LAKTKFLSNAAREHGLDFIALLETGKKDFMQAKLDRYCGGRNFVWHWTEPHGRSGGMLLGVNLDVCDVESIEEGDFFIKFHRSDDFHWCLVAIYGAAQPEFKEKFLTELLQTCSKVSLPLLVGGDFNIIRNPSEKNNDNYDDRWPFLFNAVIDGLNLREIEMSGRKFTWANSRSVPTYEKLDRVLANTEWEQRFPLVTVDALTREISDHTPILLNTGENVIRGGQPEFKFELSWFLQEQFIETVTRVWESVNYGATPMKKWQNKIRRLRKFLRGWAKNVNGSFKREKDELFRITDKLDLKVESQLLSQQELDLKQSVKERITQLLRREEIKWFQSVTEPPKL
jgi:hypothetical protein